ncbi:MAG: glycosyltransferase family 4 protein, partial [Phycisphaerae bacterium]|nr:glycosyltransferase family 4 protein [Phycisphaerae bacterium]
KGKTRIFEDASLGDIPPRVLLTGHVEDEHLPALYSGATAFVYPSLYEGFGLPPLEAMACGVPVVAANQTALPEVVGRAGIMVDPYDPDAIADGVRQIVAKEGLREDLIRCGQQRARQFTWARTAEMTWRVLREADQDS